MGVPADGHVACKSPDGRTKSWTLAHVSRVTLNLYWVGLTDPVSSIQPSLATASPEGTEGTLLGPLARLCLAPKGWLVRPGPLFPDSALGQETQALALDLALTHRASRLSPSPQGH